MNIIESVLAWVWATAFRAGFRRGLVFVHGAGICNKCKHVIESEPAWHDSPDLKEVPR